MIYESKSRTRRWYAFVAALGVLGTIVGITISGAAFGGISASELQMKLIEACGNTRGPLQVYFANELEESELRSIKDLQEAFPAFPPEEIRRSIIAKRTNLRTLLATYDPARCDDLYR